MGLNIYRPPTTNGRPQLAPQPSQIDPGPPYPGFNCHIVIDGVGYIMADAVDYGAESRQSSITESLAPYFGDPQNVLDPASSDMTMLLPVGQNDFSDGMGANKLESDPKGWEYSENLMWTAQNTLINGPLLQPETFSDNSQPINTSSPPYQSGFFAGTVDLITGPMNLLAIGNYLYRKTTGSVWTRLGNARNYVTDIQGYNGRFAVLYGDNGGDIYIGTTPTAVQFNLQKAFTLNGMPFFINKDGRIFAGFLLPPDAPTASIETGTMTEVTYWTYAVQYMLTIPSGNIFTQLGAPVSVSKISDEEVVVQLPVRGYRGGPVLRRLYRTTSNELTNWYLLADETVLGPSVTRYVDTTSDTTLTTKPTFDFTQQNNTGIGVLQGGDPTHNMAWPDTDPLILYFNNIQSEEVVNNTAKLHDASGNESVLIGTTHGLYAWGGGARSFQSMKHVPYHVLNFKYMTVNHGHLYFTLAGTMVMIWEPATESFLQGPWYTQFTTITDIRLQTGGPFVFIAVVGTLKYQPGTNSTVIYAWDGSKFAWATRYSDANSDSRYYSPVMGEQANENTFAWQAGADYTGISKISLDPLYTQFCTTGVMFRSASSDAGLPRLKKQVHAVQIRYLKLTPQPTAILNSSSKGSNSIVVNNASVFIAGDWICVRGDNGDVTQDEYRKIGSIAGNTITLTYPYYSPANLLYTHSVGNKVKRCGAVVTLRNVSAATQYIYTQAFANVDIEVGGPCEENDLFSYARLPWPVDTYNDGITINWRDGTIMELLGWAMLTGLAPPYSPLMDMHIRLMDYVKLPNNLYDNALASTRYNQLVAAYNKGTVMITDPLGNPREMRFQRMAFSYEEPKQRHADQTHMQATATIRLIDQKAELFKTESVLGAVTPSSVNLSA